MKSTLLLLISLLVIGCQVDTQLYSKETEKLFPIVENGLWGYINKLGEVVIKPQFRCAGQFSEGLASVRLNGTYGFIDGTGNFVIEPLYDIAYSFEYGQAKVYLDAKPYYIDKKGQIIFEHNFSEIVGFDENGFSVVKTQTGSYGVIDRRGVIVVDTVFQEISSFSNGIAVVTGRNHTPYSHKGEKQVYEKGVVNSKGEFVVPFGVYQDIREYKNGYAKVRLQIELPKEEPYHEGVIDTKGKLRFTIPTKKWELDYRNATFSDGLAIVEMRLDSADAEDSESFYDRYKGIINCNGDIVASNKNWQEITPFKNGRAFVCDMYGNWFLIDREGKVVNKKAYQDILFTTHGPIQKTRASRRRSTTKANSIELFEGGIEFVKTEKGWSAIDTTGKFVREPRELDAEYYHLYRKGAIIFFQKDNSTKDKEVFPLYGFWDTKTGVVVSPQFHNIALFHPADSLIVVVQDNRLGYVNRRGMYVWRAEKEPPQERETLYIDYMNTSDYSASSPYKKALAGSGGWARSRNNFKAIEQSEQFENNALSLSVRTSEKASYGEVYEGVKLYIANTSKDTFYFAAQDSRLYLTIQAQDKKGEWRDIESLPRSWCGNSYHSLFLPPEYYWELVVPVYDGEFRTRLRAALLYKKDYKEQEDMVLYSNEFEGSINPGQLWRKEPYSPSGIMDPYNE